MKKLNRLLALTMGTALLLSGCGAPSSSAPDSAPGSASSPASQQQSKLEGDLVLWTMWNDTEPQGEVIQTIADNFMEANPDVNIEIQFCGRDLSKTLKPALEGGETIDIFDYPTQYGGQLKEFCADLSDIVDTSYDCLDGQTLRDVLLPTMLETPKLHTGVDDMQIAVGYKPYMCLFMYNAGIFEEAGITATPTTWEELDAACAKINFAGYSPITFDDAYAHWLPGLYLARSKGQDWVHELVNDTTGEMWKDPAVVEMAKAYEDFAKKGYFDANVGGNKWPAGQMDIGQGKVGMYLNLTGLPTEVKDVTAEDFRWGAFNFPDVVEGETKQQTEGVAGVTMTAVNANCENKELAGEFIAFMHSSESDSLMVDAGMTTTRKDGEWPAALQDVKPAFDTVTVALESGGGLEANADLKPVISENFVKLAAGQITADQFVENMAAAAKQ